MGATKTDFLIHQIIQIRPNKLNIMEMSAMSIGRMVYKDKNKIPIEYPTNNSDPDHSSEDPAFDITELPIENIINRVITISIIASE